MHIRFFGRDHDETVKFEGEISIREALGKANILPSTVIVSMDQNILPHSAIIKSTLELEVTIVSSGG